MPVIINKRESGITGPIHKGGKEEWMAGGSGERTAPK